MISLSSLSVHDCSITRYRAYIYAVYSPEFSCCYIGQTRSQYGALGRLSQHLSEQSNNTFIQKICHLWNYEEVFLGKLEFLAIPLNHRQEFWNKSCDYREAVEYLVQEHLINYVEKVGLRISFIAFVRTNKYQKLDFVIDESSSVSQKISGWLSQVSIT